MSAAEPSPPATAAPRASIGRNTVYNLIGYLVPTLLALATVPAYLALIGPERYGVLALAWLILGYFGIFDLGLGRATSQRIAALRDGTAQDRAIALDTALVTNLGIGLIGAAILWPVAHYAFAEKIALSAALRAEALAAVPYLACAVPIATTLGVLSGALIGREKFLQTNRISVTSTILFQLFPLGIAFFIGPDLPRLILASLAARAIGVAMLWLACRREFGAGTGSNWSRDQLRGLLAFGGWVTLTSLCGPLLVFSDRLFIGAMIGAVSVTVYTVPMEAVRRLSGVAISLTNALFPRFASASTTEAAELAKAAAGTLYALLTPFVAAALILLDPLIRLWLGDELGSQALPLGRMFLVATWFNVFAQAPLAWLQARGRPDLVSKAMLVQVPFYLLAMWLALDKFGLWGGVCVYLVRVIFDTLLLLWLANRRIILALPLLLTLVLFTGIGIGMRDTPHLGFTEALLWGILCGIAFLAPAWVVAPQQLRAKAFGLLRRFARD